MVQYSSKTREFALDGLETRQTTVTSSSLNLERYNPTTRYDLQNLKLCDQLLAASIKLLFYRQDQSDHVLKTMNEHKHDWFHPPLC